MDGQLAKLLGGGQVLHGTGCFTTCLWCAVELSRKRGLRPCDPCLGKPCPTTHELISLPALLSGAPPQTNASRAKADALQFVDYQNM